MPEGHDVAARLSFTRKSGSWISGGETNEYATGTPDTYSLIGWEDVQDKTEDTWEPVQDGVAEAAPIATCAALAYFDGNGEWLEGAINVFRRYACYEVASISTSFMYTAHFYNYATTYDASGFPWFGPTQAVFETSDDVVASNSWSIWSSVGPDNSGSVTSAVLGSTSLPAWCAEPLPDDNSTASGYEVTNGIAIIEWQGLYTPAIADPVLHDTDADGLVATPCDCADCLPGFDIKLEDIARLADCAYVQFPLGVSDGSTNGGLRVRAYTTQYSVDGEERQMFSLDTAVVATNWNATEGWSFVTVKRPSGAEVTFSLKGDTPGKPVGMKRSYSMVETQDGDYEIHFPGSSDVVHKFDGASNHLEEIRITTDHEELTVAGSPTNWPGMTTYLSNEQISSNVCPVMVAIPTYGTNDLITQVTYKDLDGNTIYSLSLTNNGTRLIAKNAAGEPIKEQRIVFTNDTMEIWSGVDTNGVAAQKVVRSESFDEDAGTRTVTETTVLSPGQSDEQSNTTVSVVTRFDWGDEITSVTAGYGGSGAQVSSYTYHTNWTDSNNYTRLKLVESPDGSWSRCLYDGDGRQTNVCTPFKNGLPTADADDSKETRYYYAGDSILWGLNFPAVDVALTNDHRPRLVIERIDGAEVSRTYHAYLADQAVTKRCVTSGASYTATNNLTTTTEVYTNGAFEGRTRLVVNPDGTRSVFTYGYSSVSGQLTATNRTGAGTGYTVTNGIQTVTVMDAGNRVLSVVSEDIDSGLTISSMSYVRDPFGRALCASNVLAGTYTTNQYGCCGVDWTEDDEGIETALTYTDLGQLYITTRLGVTVANEHDVLGNVIKTTRSASGEDAIAVGSVYDEAGRLVASTNELWDVTSIAYSTNASGGKVVTATYPDTSTRVETYYRCGELQSVTGTAVSAVYYDFVIEDGQLCSVEYRGSDTNATEWVKTCRNMLGSTAKIVYPDGYTNTISYDAYGRQVEQDDGITATLTEYNSKGEAYRSAVDMDRNGVLDESGPDRIMETERSYSISGYLEVVTKVYATNSSPTATTVSTVRTDVDDSDSWSISFGRTNHTSVSRDRANAARTETTTRPDGTQTIGYYTNGLVRRIVEKDSAGGTVATMTRTYDGFHRLKTTQEPAANGDTRTTTFSYDAASQVTNVNVAAGSLSQDTGYEFDSMGRRTKTILPDDGEVTYKYATTGALTNHCGARTYPVSYSYTLQGRMATMSTYRDGLTGDADVTTWNYDSQRGWLNSKVYADNSTNSYEYFDNGSLKKRTWARGLYTDFLYDNGGSLTNVNYSDAATADIGYVRDRLGRASTVSDAAGTWTNSYAADGQLASVTLPHQPDWSIEYSFDSIGRVTNQSIITGGTTSVSSASYTFDNAGRYSAVSDGTRSVTYSRGDDGTTITNITFGGPLTVSKTYDGLNRLTQVSNVPTNGSTFSYQYAYNDANLRTTNVMADGSYWVYGYDSLGQVTSGRKYFSDGREVGGCQFLYSFDQIGNRTTAKNFRGGSTKTSTYYPNELNQYTSRTVPGEVFVTGTAVTNATVAVRLNTNSAASLAQRHGTYFWKALDADNSSSVFSTTNIQARAYMTSGTNSLVRLETREALVAKTPEQFSYDPDGNQLSDGIWTNTWSCENRMVETESLAMVPDGWKVKVGNKFDFQGRRFRKTVSTDYTGGVYQTTNVVTFVYNGWNLVAEMSDAGYTNYYQWGIDASGTLQGAGGVGGLLSMTRVDASGTNTYFYCADGNGNIMALVDESGTIVAEYEYSPFGVLTKCTGSMADKNPFRFSSKYFDSETGLYYFGFRFYDPVTGRWRSRDRIGERGGVGLYVFIQNGPISDFDVLGAIAGSAVSVQFRDKNNMGVFLNKADSQAYRRLKVRPAKTTEVGDEHGGFKVTYGGYWSGRSAATLCMIVIEFDLSVDNGLAKAATWTSKPNNKILYLPHIEALSGYDDDAGWFEAQAVLMGAGGFSNVKPPYEAVEAHERGHAKAWWDNRKQIVDKLKTLTAFDWGKANLGVAALATAFDEEVASNIGLRTASNKEANKATIDWYRKAGWKELKLDPNRPRPLGRPFWKFGWQKPKK